MKGLEAIIAGHGVALAVVGMVVVFIALAFLMLMMKGLKKAQDAVLALEKRRRSARAAGTGAEAALLPEEGDLPGVLVAAIALTLILEEEQIHDEESLVLTLHSMPKPYSNWWQGTLRRAWSARLTGGRPTVMQTEDPERGTKI